jgi:amidase
MALERAKEIDEYYATHKKPIGPLHGLPISLKVSFFFKVPTYCQDQFHVKGVETSMGYVAWLGTKATRDSVLTEALRAAGAVFYVKTNVPMALMVCSQLFI